MWFRDGKSQLLDLFTFREKGRNLWWKPKTKRCKHFLLMLFGQCFYCPYQRDSSREVSKVLFEVPLTSKWLASSVWNPYHKIFLNQRRRHSKRFFSLQKFRFTALILKFNLFHWIEMIFWEAILFLTRSSLYRWPFKVYVFIALSEATIEEGKF